MSEEKTAIHSIRHLVGSQRAANAAFLIIISTKSPALIGRMIKLEGPETVLGRSAETQLLIEDDGVSRKHCRIALTAEGGYQLSDLGSTNGTFLNGTRVDCAMLSDGDKIQIGATTVVKFSVQDQLEEQYQKSIYENATRDGLTRIFNKKYFLDTLRKEFAYCLRHHVSMSLVMCDVDHFKRVNDVYGHPAGDYVLQRVAQKIGETVRQEDLFARYGGEEFVVMLRESDSDKAVRCAERCRRAVEGANFVFNGTPLKVTISLGVATLTDSDFASPDDLVAAADKYLYRAKNGGRNRVDAKELSGG